MKTPVSSRKNSFIENVPHIHYLHTRNTTLHKPCADSKGIHCVGDKYAYIVDWQMSEKKREIILAK